MRPHSPGGCCARIDQGILTQAVGRSTGGATAIFRFMTSLSDSSSAQDRIPAIVAGLCRQVTERLVAGLCSDGHWEGRLSSSALATAVATFALAQTDPARFQAEIRRGLGWLASTQTADGSWGDTPDSPGNLSTTLLCWSALAVTPETAEATDNPRRRAEAWLTARVGSLTPDDLAAAVLRHYGNDRTFSAPILTLCALAGRLGTPEQAWPLVPQLPFELALLPHRLFRWLRLPVVSYAIPALIAIGLVRHRHRPSRNPALRLLRNVAEPRVLAVLTGIQPTSGGFLEATPLTAFVVTCLAACGLRTHPVTNRGSDFLLAAQRDDGSWPIDTHLATWVTTLAVNALGTDLPGLLTAEQRTAIRDWLLAQHFRPDRPRGDGVRGNDLPPSPRPPLQRATGPFSVGAAEFAGVTDAQLNPVASAPANPAAPGKSGSATRQGFQGMAGTHPLKAPGGWSWTPLSGGVPDADDTAGALLALHRLGPVDDATRAAVAAGITWLLDLQNRDGGIPTFCRGWGKLPFDRSCPDLTAHALRALAVWLPELPAPLQQKMRRRMARGLAYLIRSQQPDGSWLPLWFGNQTVPRHENPTYGTAQVLLALQELVVQPVGEQFRLGAVAEAGERWLVAAQNPDGGWGGAPGVPSSIEETSLALAAIAGSTAVEREVLSRGIEWLAARIQADPELTPAPIGLYFASLWYSERLYPVIFATLALDRFTSATWSQCERYPAPAPTSRIETPPVTVQPRDGA